jgi:Chromate transport protein ChrA
MIFWELFVEFFQIGLFSVGGGMATIPFLMALSQSKGWFSLEELANMIAVSQCIPGPLGVAMSSYVGMMTAGIGGTLSAVFGLILPSVAVIFIVARMMDEFRNNKWVDGVFTALRPMALSLIFCAGMEVCQIAFVTDFGLNWLAILFGLITLAGCRWEKTQKIHPIAWIVFGAVGGILLL